MSTVTMTPTMEELAFTDEEIEQLIEDGFNPEDAPAICTPICIGPTWQKDAFGNWILPEHTLGWEIAEWCAEYLLADDGSPWKFTLEQLRFVLWWYAVDPVSGRFVYRTGVLQRMKGWGKDPLLAIICLVEFVGPSRVVGWKADGTPVGGRPSRTHVQITAVTQDQTTNTMDMIPGMMSDKFKREYNVREGIELIRACNGKCKIQAVTSNPRALEGKRTTFTLLNETHHWIESNKGWKMFETIDGNSTKMAARYLAITNAYLPGEDSIGERMRESYNEILEGKIVKDDFLYDSVEADPRAPLYGPLLPRVLERIRGDAYWSPIDEILSSIADRNNRPQRSRRMWLNQIIADEDALFNPSMIKAIEDPNLPPLKDGDEIVMGFDGSKTDDATALVVIRIGDMGVFVHGLWESPRVKVSKADEEWEVDRLEVDSAVAECFRRFKVRAFFADVARWETYIDKWAYEYGDRLNVKALNGHRVGWDMRSSLKTSTLAHERLLDAIFNQTIRFNGDRRLVRHLLNVRRRDNTHGVYFGKESRRSQRKIDVYTALVLAHEALVSYRQRGKTEKEKTRRGYFV